jgi:two-component system, response regulator PdtaR
VRLLIVGDDPLVALASGAALAEAGHCIVGVEGTGRGALARVAAAPVDLVLADLGLGDQTGGVALAREARSRCGTPALLLSANLELAREGRPWALGCLRKPYSAGELVQAVAACERALQDGSAPGAPPEKLELY